MQTNEGTRSVDDGWSDEGGDGFRLAVVGAGYWGINYVRLLDSLPTVASVTVCDARSGRLKEIGERYPRVELCDRLEDVVEDDSIEAVVVATPATTHHEVAKELLSGGKHLLVEKPLAVTSGECAELVEMADDLGLRLAVGHTFLHHPAVKKVKEYVSGTPFGRPYYLYSRRTNLGPIRHDVSALWDLAPHDVSIFNHLLDDEPVWVSGVAHHPLGSKRADVGFVSMGYSNNVLAHLHVSWADPDKVRELVVVSPERRIVFDDLNINEWVRVYEKGVAPIEATGDFGEAQLDIRDGDIISPRIGPSEPLANQCTDFLEAIREDRAPISDGGTGHAVVKVMEAIDRSIALNGAPVLVSDLSRVDGGAVDENVGERLAELQLIS